MKSQERKNVDFSKLFQKMSKNCAFISPVTVGNFPKNTPESIDPFGRLSFMNFFVIIIFSVNLPLLSIYKFWKREIQLQPPGEPQEHHRGEFLQGRSKSKSFFGVSGFHSSNYLEMKTILSSNFQNIQLETLKLPEVLVNLQFPREGTQK